MACCRTAASPDAPTPRSPASAGSAACGFCIRGRRAGLRHRGAVRLRQQVRAIYPGTAASSRRLVDPDSYRRIVGGILSRDLRRQAQQRLVRPQQLLPSRGGDVSPEEAARRFLLVVAGFYTAGDDDLAFLVSYATRAGTSYLGPVRVRRPGGLYPRAAATCRPERGGRRLVRRDDEPPLTGRGRLRPAGWISRGVRRAAHTRWGRRPGAIRASAPGPLGGGDDERGTGPDHRGRRPPGPDAGAIPRRLARPRAVGGWTLPASVTAATANDRLTPACAAQLELGRGDRCRPSIAAGCPDQRDDHLRVPGAACALGRSRACRNRPS